MNAFVAKYFRIDVLGVGAKKLRRLTSVARDKV